MDQAQNTHELKWFSTKWMMPTSTENKLYDFTLLLSRVYREQTQMEITSLVETLSLHSFLPSLDFQVCYKNPELQLFIN